MAATSSPDRYGSVAIVIHWSSALAVILAFAAGTVAADFASPERQASILIAHITLGSIVLLLTLLRIVWWMVADKRPADPAGTPRAQALTARGVHIGLYVLLILMGTSGITTLVLSGAIPTLLAGGPVPDLSQLVPRMAHGIMSKLLLVLFIGHFAAALYHQYVRRDHLLARMGIGRA